MNEQPLVSIIIPAKNSIRILPICLEAIARQTYPRIETIVVDNGSDDETAELAAALGARVCSSGGLMTAARNRGAAGASGDYLLHIDSDMELAPRAVEQCVAVAKADAADMVIIPERNVSSGYWMRAFSFQKILFEGMPGHENARFVSRQAYDAVSGFDEHLEAGEDADFHLRLLHKGFRLARIDATTRHHVTRLSLRDVLRKSRRYDATRAAYATKHGWRRPDRDSWFRVLFQRRRTFLEYPAESFGWALVSLLLFGQTASRRLRDRLHSVETQPSKPGGEASSSRSGPNGRGKAILILRRAVPKRNIYGKGYALLMTWNLLRRFPGLLGYLEAETAPTVRINLDLNDRIQWMMFWDLYEQRELAWVLSRLRPGDIFLDVGGHIGFFAIHAARRVGPSGRVHVVEAVPSNCDAIAENIRLNHLTQVKLHQVAASSMHGEATFYLTPNPAESGWGSVYPRGAVPAHQQLCVETAPLDDLVPAEDVARLRVIKMDIEGHELEALAGMPRLLQEGSAVIVCELNADQLAFAGSSPRQLIDMFRSYGYLPYRLDKNGVEEVLPDTHFVLANVVFSKDPL